MSERYSKLFSLPENQYATGSPVVIAAGALLKDNQTGKVIAQLKLRNVGPKAIKAAKVCISPFDTVGNSLGDAVQYQYLDLNAKRNEDFGQKAAITLPDAATRSFAATVEEIAFTDNTIWKATGEPWEVLSVPSSISRIHGMEFEKQFRMKYGADCINLPLSEKDLWYCACGALNRQEEADCHACRKSHAILNSIDYDVVRAEMEARRAAEKERAEQEAAAARAHAKRMGKIAAIVVPIIVVVAVAAVLVTSFVKKSNAYKNALMLLDAGQYTEAIEAFALLGDYKDSPEQIDIAEELMAEAKHLAELETTYNNALSLIKAGEHQKAYDKLLALGDYRDTQTYLEGFHEKLTLIKYTTPNTRYYSFDLKYTYDDMGRVKNTTQVYHQTGYRGYTALKEYRYLADGTEEIICSYPETKVSDYSYNTIVGEKLIYDTEKELFHYQQILHNGTISHTFYLRYNEDNELLTTNFSDSYIQDINIGKEGAYAAISVVNSKGYAVRSWTEKIDSEGVFTGIVYNEIECQHDEEGRIVAAIGENSTTYYTYQDDKVIREETGKIVKTYDYNGNGDVLCITERHDGELASTTEYIYGMVYTPKMESEK